MFVGVILIFCCLLPCISAATFWIQSALSFCFKSLSHIPDLNSPFFLIQYYILFMILSIQFLIELWLLGWSNLFSWYCFTLFLYHFRVAAFALICCLSSSAALLYPFLLTQYRWSNLVFWLLSQHSCFPSFSKTNIFCKVHVYLTEFFFSRMVLLSSCFFLSSCFISLIPNNWVITNAHNTWRTCYLR